MTAGIRTFLVRSHLPDLPVDPDTCVSQDENVLGTRLGGTTSCEAFLDISMTYWHQR